jgi:hypothetical protein
VFNELIRIDLDAVDVTDCHLLIVLNHVSNNNKSQTTAYTFLKLTPGGPLLADKTYVLPTFKPFSKLAATPVDCKQYLGKEEVIETAFYYSLLLTLLLLLLLLLVVVVVVVSSGSISRVPTAVITLGQAAQRGAQRNTHRADHASLQPDDGGPASFPAIQLQELPVC